MEKKLGISYKWISYLVAKYNALLVADVFKNLQSKCTETYEPTLLIDAPFENIKVELEFLATIEMLLMIKNVSKMECVILFIDM